MEPLPEERVFSKLYILLNTRMPDDCHSHRKVSGLGLWIISFTVGPVLKLYNRSIASSLEKRERGELWCGERGGTEERTWRKGWQWLGEKGSSPSSPKMRHTYPSQLTWSCMCVHVHVKRAEINRLITTLSTKKIYCMYCIRLIRRHSRLVTALE